MPVPEPARQSEPTPHADLRLLLDAARAAGEIARRHFRSEPKAWDKGGGLGPVSEADLEIDAMLRDRLLRARPDHGWLSEETEDDPARLSAGRLFIVDPIDGTRAFLEGQPGFAHALAIVEDGIVRAGVVHLPVLDKTYSALAGKGAWLNDQALSLPPFIEDMSRARVLASRKQMEPQHWRNGIVPQVERHFRSSLAWRLCLVAEGAFDGTLTHHATWEWDTAAASLIAQEAGARVTDRAGARLAFNRPRPASKGLLAAAPALHAGLLSKLV